MDDIIIHNLFSPLICDHKSRHYSRHSPTSENDPSCRFAEEMKSWEGPTGTIHKERKREDDEVAVVEGAQVVVV